MIGSRLTEGRPYVKTVSWLRWNPMLVDADELLDELEQSITVKRLFIFDVYERKL